MSFLSSFYHGGLATSDKPAVFDQEHPSGVSFAQLDQDSGKVYAYLKDRGIGRECFVMINLPKGYEVAACMLGIWKSGAACVIVDEDYPRARMDFIYQDCGCVLELNHAVWKDMMSCKAQAGYEETDPHDAAFATYTSGSTGKPKGVVQEFGLLDLVPPSLDVGGKNLFAPDDVFAWLFPQCFAVYPSIHPTLLRKGIPSLFLPTRVLRNPIQIREWLETYKVNCIFIQPSLVKALVKSFHSLDKNVVFGSCMEKITCIGEPVRDIFFDNLEIYNLYAQSESGFANLIFRIDKAYQITPIGKPTISADDTIVLCENGTTAACGEKGEICTTRPFFRGHLNRPDINDHIPGTNYFRTGDAGKYLPDGNILYLGRLDDMFKIRDFRIEPAEIELAIMKCFGVSWAGAKEIRQNDISFICGYYIEEPAVSKEKAVEEMRKTLPEYMIPTCFMKIDSIPQNTNGKFSRRGLPEPDVSMNRRNYEPPQNKDEKRLASIMEHVLGTAPFGLHDSFFDFGGDSLNVMQVVMEMGLPGFSAEHVYQGKTVKNIIQRYRDDQKQDVCVRQKDYALTPCQQYMMDMMAEKSSFQMFNLRLLLSVRQCLDINRFKRAVSLAVRTHPAFQTRFFKTENGYRQRFEKSDIPEIIVEKITFDELFAVKDKLQRPFDVTGEPLYRLRLFQTEKGLYLYCEFSHLICDGQSLQIFMRDIRDAYENRQLPEDTYESYLYQQEHISQNSLYQKAKEYFEEKYSQTVWKTIPHTGKKLAGLDFGLHSEEIPVPACSLNKNLFYLTACLAAVWEYNGMQNTMITWTYNGRKTVREQNVFGLLIQDLPVAVKRGDRHDIGSLLEAVRTQVREGIANGMYPYTVGDTEEALCFIYQSNLRGLDHFKGISDFFELVPLERDNGPAENLINWEIMDRTEGISLECSYPAERYSEVDIERLVSLYKRNLTRILNFPK